MWISAPIATVHDEHICHELTAVARISLATRRWYSDRNRRAAVVLGNHPISVRSTGKPDRHRIPRSLAEQIGLGAGTEVSLSAKDGQLVVKPVLPTRLSLDELLAGVTDNNLHSSLDSGSAVGVGIF
jgi:antitoxin MazE